jgi:hypothetical protein
MKTTTKDDVPLSEAKKHTKQPIRLKTVSGNGLNPEAFDKKFDEGIEDIIDSLNLSTIYRPNQEKSRNG